MKISVSKIFKTEKFPENLIYKSVLEHINNSGFPKNLLIKNLVIQEGHINFKLKNINNLIFKGQKALTQVETGNSSLKRECLILLEELKIY